MTKSGQRLALSELAKLHVERLAAIEAASEPVYAIPSEYPAGYHVKATAIAAHSLSMPARVS